MYRYIPELTPTEQAAGWLLVVVVSAIASAAVVHLVARLA